MKRRLAIVGVLAAVAVVAAVAFFAFPRNVEVQSGTRYVCTYGESLGSDVRTLEVREADASKYSVVTKTTTCSRHKQAEDLYLKAQQALKSGDTKNAGKLLAQVVALDPKYKQAAAQVSLINSGKKPAPDTAPTDKPSSPATNTPSDPKPSDSPAMDGYRWLVPDAIPGFTAEGVSAEALALTRAYAPSDRGRYDQLVIMVQQYRSEAAAKETVNTEVTSAYPSGKKVSQSGLSGWFGVNGNGFAALSLARGEIVVTFELHSTTGKPVALESDLREIASRILK